MPEERGLTVGQYLRQERERRNLSLESVAGVTRITLKNLQALENDKFGILPASVFVRGFLRIYAAHLGLDPKEVLALYETQMDFYGVSQKVQASPPPKRFQPVVKFSLIIVSIALAAYVFFSFFYQKTPVQPPSQPAPSPGALSLPTPPEKELTAEASPTMDKDSLKTPGPSTTSPKTTPDITEASKKKERRHVLKVKTTETTWLRIRADDQPEVNALLQPRETATWTARRQFKVTVGNAGGVDIFFNGVPQGRLGDSGQVVHLLLPKEIKKRTTAEKKKEP